MTTIQHPSPPRRSIQPRNIGSTILLAITLAASVGVLVLGFTWPMYSGSYQDGSGIPIRTSRTLVEANGPRGAIVVSAPLIATVVIIGARFLLRGIERTVLSWIVVALLAAFSIAGMWTVGRFLLPVALILALAVATHRTPR